MKLPWHFLTLVLAVVAGSLLLAACGGDGGEGEELSLEEYFQQFDAIEEVMYTSIGTLEEESEGVVGEDIETTQDYIAGYHDIVEQGLNDVRALQGPSEVGDAQDEFAAALSSMISLWDDLSDRLADVETTSELQDLLLGIQNDAQWLDASQQFTDACLELQGIADDNGIQVVLDCE
jgi:hypothetical protein